MIQQQPADSEHNFHAVTDAELEDIPEVGNLTRKEGKTGTGLTMCSTLSPTERVEFVTCEAATGAFKFSWFF